MQWEQALCLTLAWLVVYLCILRGTESTGKVSGHSPAEPQQDVGEDKRMPKRQQPWLLLLEVMASPLEQPAPLPLPTC